MIRSRFGNDVFSIHFLRFLYLLFTRLLLVLCFFLNLILPLHRILPEQERRAGVYRTIFTKYVEKILLYVEITPLLQTLLNNMASNLKRSNSSQDMEQRKKRENEVVELIYDIESYLLLKNKQITRKLTLTQLKRDLDQYIRNSENVVYDPYNLCQFWDIPSKTWFERKMSLAQHAMSDGIRLLNVPKTLREQSKFIVYLFRLPIKSLPRTLKQEMASEFHEMWKKTEEEQQTINKTLSNSAEHFNSAAGTNINCIMM